MASKTSALQSAKQDVRKVRRKSDGTLKEKAFAKDRTYTSVTCRLQSICNDPHLCDEIRRSALIMRRVQMETWHLVNLHSLRCLENGIELPDYSDVTFYAHCFTGLSIKVYKSQRQQSGLDEIRHQPGYTELKAELASQMDVNAIVMISQHFIKRLRLYVQITFGGLGSNDGGEQSKEGKALVKDIMRACFNTDETDIVEALQMHDVLTPAGTPWGEQWILWANHVKENAWWKERWLRRLTLRTYERSHVFPVPTSYSAAHIKINGSTLAGFYSRIMLRVEGYHSYAPGTVLTVHSFQANRWAMLRAAFDIARFKTRTSQSPLTKVAFDELSVEDKYDHASRLFANQVTSDGYGASILFYKLKQEDKAPSDAPVISVGYVPDIVIGLDPGMRSVCTAVREVFRLNAGRHRQRRRRRRRGGGQRMPGRRGKRPRWIRRFKDPVRQNDREIVQVSAREYHHMAGLKRFQSWNEGLKKRSPEYRDVIDNMPSFKTSSYHTYLDRLQFFWSNVEFLLRFSADRPFLKWKFFRKRMARVTVDALAKRIVPVVSNRTCVAFGDWSRRNGIRGHASSPVKGLKQALQKRAMVVSMDEFRTSKLCSQCHQELSSVRYTIDGRYESWLRRRESRYSGLDRSEDT